MTNSYGYLTSFGGGSLLLDRQYTGVAVAQASGTILVTDYNQGTVGIYAPDPMAGGSLLATLNVAGSPAQISPQNLAVDPTDDSLFVSGPSGIAKFISDHAPTPTYTYDATFTSAPLPTGASGMAVDPVSHDLLVVDRGAQRVFRLSSSNGALLSSFDGADSAGDAFQGPGAVAVGPTGTIYVVDDAGSRVERFSTTGTSQGTLPVIAGGQPVALAVHPQSGAIVVAVRWKGQTYLQGFDSAGSERFLTRFPSPAISQDVDGVAWDGNTERIYVNVRDATVRAFVPATQPGVDTPTISTVGRNTAHVVANVATTGQTTTARLEYCRASAACDDYPLSDPGDPGNPWVRAADHVDPTGNPVRIEDDLPLDSNASWKVRAFAASTQVDGVVTEATSGALSFESPLILPAVETGRPASVTSTTAELTGTIAAVGAQTTYHFEYGLTTAYGSQVPADGEGTAGSGRRPRIVSRAIDGLQPGTTYHYRLVARNAAGEAAGADQAFDTPATDPLPRRFEQVTPVDKQGAVVNALFGLQPAPDGSAVSYLLTAPPKDAPSAVAFARYMSRRGAADWQNWAPLDPPLSVSRGIIEAVTHAVSADFAHTMVVSNRVLAPGAAEGGGNIYVKDLNSGAYTLVGSSPGLTSYLAMASPQTEKMFLAGAPDFSWITFLSPVRLLDDAPTTALYRWTRADNRLTLESSSADDVQAPSPPTELTSRFVSDDGSIMYYNLTNGPVYRHELHGATAPISVSHVGATVNTAFDGKLDGISRDGRYAFFRSAEPLTADAPVASTSHVYMYRYDTQSDDLEFAGSPVNQDPGRVMAVGDDGRTVYFLSEDGTDVWRDGVLRTFTAMGAGANGVGFGFQVFGSPNGRYLAYLGDDAAAYLYDAENNTNVCVSCPIDGGEGGRDAGFPGGTRTVSNRAPLVVSDSGTMFFDTNARLLSADHNGSRDVYAYHAGALTLVSPGEGDFTARFADATPDARDVYFTTAQSLVGKDTDRSVDLYDARIDGFPDGSPRETVRCARNECAEPTAGPVSSPPGPAEQQPMGAPTKPSRAAPVRLSRVKVTFGARTLRVSFRASQRGRLQVSGVRVVKTLRNVAKAGTYSITVPLTKRARALRSAHRRFKVSVKVTLTGGWGSSSVKYSRTLGK